MEGLEWDPGGLAGSVRGGQGREEAGEHQEAGKEGGGKRAQCLSAVALRACRPCSLFAKWGGSTLDSPLPGDSDEAKSQALWVLGGTGMQVGENTP